MREGGEGGGRERGGRGGREGGEGGREEGGREREMEGGEGGREGWMEGGRTTLIMCCASY